MIPQNDMQLRVEKVFALIRPEIEMHGGNIEFVRYKEGILTIRFLGACVGCPAAAFTLKLGIEEAIKAHMPEVVEVVSVD